MEYKAFRIGALFEKLNAPYIGAGRKQDNVSKERTEEFSLPLINCKWGDNGIMYYGRPSDFVHYENVLSVVYNGPPTVGTVYAQPLIGVFTDAYLIALKKSVMPHMSMELCLYLKTAVEKAIHDTKYSRADKATWTGKVENDEIFLTASKAPVFAKCFYCPDQSVEDRCEAIIQTMREIMDHQSNEATDIRFVALYFNQLSGEVHLLREQVDLLVAYPSSKHTDEIMCMARPTVRSLEMMILTFEEVDSAYLKEFWRCVSEMTDCSIFAIRFSEEKRNITAYMEKLHEVFVYLSELFLTADPLNEKMSVLLGIATYSYKRLKEIYEHQLFNSISGRSCVRVLIEDYIMMKYLVKNESFHENIWRDYQLYGMGLYKLVLARHRENGALEECRKVC